MKNIFLSLLFLNLSACSIINIFEEGGDEKQLVLHLEACGEKKNSSYFMKSLWKYKFVVKIYYLKK